MFFGCNLVDWDVSCYYRLSNDKSMPWPLEWNCIISPKSVVKYLFTQNLCEFSVQLWWRTSLVTFSNVLKMFNFYRISARLWILGGATL